MRNNRRAAQRHTTDETLGKFKVQIRKFIDVVATHRFILEGAWFFTFGNEFRVDTLQHKNAGSIVRNQRIKRIHYQVEYFLEVQRTADLFPDVEQHAKLVECGQAM